MHFFKTIFKFIKSVIFLTFLTLLVIFLVNNRDKVTLHFTPLNFDIETRMFLVIMAFFLAGVVLGALIISKSLFKKTVENAKNRQKIKKLEKNSQN